MELKVATMKNEMKQETFIPVTRFALREALVNQAEESGEKSTLVELFQVLGLWRHQEYYQRLLVLKECYLPFSPDRDTVRALTYSKEELTQLQKKLIQGVNHLLERGNYSHIDEEQLNLLFSTNSAHGLKLSVDQTEYDEMLLFSRGIGSETLVKQNWQTFFKKQTTKIPTFKRLFLLFKLKDEDARVAELMTERQVDEKKARKIVQRNRRQLPRDDKGSHVYLKIFKNIPQEDVEMMFPNTNVQFKLFDKIKLTVTAGGGTVAGVASSATKIAAAAAAANPITLAGGILGLSGIVLRQVLSFFNTRNRYMLTLSTRLYFHALADNRGALTLLCDRGEEEDVKEEMLLYWFLHLRPTSKEKLDGLRKRIEQYLFKQFGVEIRFDLYDALERLEGDGLATTDAQGIVSVTQPAQASVLLQQKLQSVFFVET
ncbi:MAG: hypothetical protein ACI8P9_003385 [Parasphingorhabdus sp.]|jgi:hypothetical protein